MNFNPEPIHRWDSRALLKALMFGALSEAIFLAPAVLSPWGHAGPESLWGWLGLLLNAPGMLVIGLLRRISGSTEDVSIVDAIVYTYLAQTLILSYIAFVWLRWKKRKAVAS